MIVDLRRFIERGEPHWRRLEELLARIESAPDAALTLAEIGSLHTLYERTGCDLAELETNTLNEPSLHERLERLMARAYGEIHAQRTRRIRFAPLAWFSHAFPQAFRRRFRHFALSVAIMAGGMLFGGAAVLLDPSSRGVLLPFGHDRIDPGERVTWEEQSSLEQTGGRHSFSARLLQNNVRASCLTLAAGITFGIGSALLLFSNGAALGGIIADYLAGGQGLFLAGWLLPHGAVEIPCILIAGQAGLLLGMALCGRRSRLGMGARMREVLPDLATLAGGTAILLVYAALVESFLSQYHSPALYPLKIAFGLAELLVLGLFLSRAGRPLPTA